MRYEKCKSILTRRSGEVGGLYIYIYIYIDKDDPTGDNARQILLFVEFVLHCRQPDRHGLICVCRKINK